MPESEVIQLLNMEENRMRRRNDSKDAMDEKILIY